MSTVAIITARGGSKRIPRKNIRPFLGKPIIAYVIDAALQSNLFDEVMVSTDDEEIAAIAQQYGAVVPFLRQSKTSGDHASTIDVLLEVLDEYELIGRTYESLCCLYPTAPFITSQLLKTSYELLLEKQVDIVYPLQQFSFPIQRAFKLNSGIITWADPNSFLLRSQDLEPMYHDTGQFYWFNVNPLRQHQRLANLTAGGIVIDEMHAHDIDTEDDWQIAEFKYRLLHNMHSYD
ncbi:pseudaminic acid cytidylyltransferase [Spirosoma sp. RP8]|uniref:Pseudaminic acid cytidylyltransferase n=1 Tax=Spirosoma liriopis TaxID=2937440 RepID=A0ABT0HLR2_9BACT|nr:pseudaminic acid cytidylyltransferase [Spirosoma liriopis]MCK8493083.1 pseudaminic acid cytidylyltransferase [Spirosoma liriopis]